MPPRRSTRAARASVEPDSMPPPTSKRKRTSAVDENGQDTIKPPSRSRKSATPAPTKAVPTGRRKSSLREVQESDEEEEAEEAPPVKRSKSNPDEDEVQETSDDEAEEVRPKARRAPAAKGTAPKARRRATAEDVTDEDAPVPTKTSQRASSSKLPSATRATKSSGKSKPVKTEVDSDEEPMPVTKNRRAAAKPPSKRPTGRRSALAEPVEETVEEVEEDEEAAPPSVQPQAKVTEESEDDEADEVAANLTREMDIGSDEDQRPTKSLSPSKRVLVEEEEEEEEHSLLDPPPVPSSQARAPPPPEEPTGPRSRLVIHKMALVNFKSYAGRQEIGPFHKSFSAIVGPNGSGKSNTIDALLFVFGYRASKMRQGKLSELIHNSANYEDLDFCTVEVHFREIIDLPGPDAFEIVPETNLIVARTAYRNNSSKYTINGSPSSFTEVTTLLKERGIDLDHKRFLILQGEVESIALMKPKAQTEHEDGLLEYLEDIIGTTKYKNPIDEALVEMDRLGEERGEKIGRLRITEREKNLLEDQKRDAENYLRLQNEHARAQSRLWQYYLWKCLETGKEFSARQAEVAKELKDERERNKDDIDHLKALEKHFADRKKLYEEVKDAAKNAANDLAEHERKEIGLDERVKHSKSKAKKLKKTLDDDRKAQAEATRAIEDNKQKVEKERKTAEQHERELEQEEKELSKIQESLKDKTQVFHDQIEAKQKELQPWTTKINQKQAQINIAQSERDTLAQKAESARKATKEAEEALFQLQAQLGTKNEELDQKQQERATALQDSQSAQSKLVALRARVEELRRKSASTRQRVDEVKASQTQATTQNRVLDSLTALRQRGGVEGFYGRLGNLGTIDDKYDVAISTACPTLHHMIVDKVSQAEQCIKHLRAGNIGRASFMALEKVDKSGGAQRIQTPENAPRLYDLVKPNEPKFAPAFYKALRDTLVAEDLEQANRIAFGTKRWRVVTLSGQLIDTSGTMAGGGSSVSRGAMSSKRATDTVSPETIRQYQADSEKAAQDLEAASGQLRVAELDVDRFSTFGPALDTSIDKLSMEVANSQARIAEAAKRLKDLQAQSKPDSRDVARINKLEGDMESLTTELTSLQNKTEHISEAIQALEQKIVKIGGSRLLAQKSKVESLRLQISVANDEVTKAEVAITKADKDVAKLAVSIRNNTASLEEVEEELQKLSDDLQDCKSTVNTFRTKLDDARDAEENSKNVYDQLKAELDEKNEAVQDFRKIEASLERQLKEIESEMAQNEKAIDHYQSQHDNLRLEDVDSDDEEEAEHAPEDGTDEKDPPVKIDNEAGGSGKRKGPRASTNTLELYMYSTTELAQFKKNALVADVALLDDQLKAANPNLGVLKEYRRREEEYLRRARELEEVTAQRDSQKQKYDGLRKQRLDEFMAGFNSISLKLKEMYQMITLGGNAELELVDSMDPFSEGIIFSVMPPKKSWKNISNLSGGEKTLSSLALVFALHHFKPTPLYFMDEIDAALDFRNVSIVANYIKDRTKDAQFIIISLRNDMFELSHRLIGIYKTANTTKSVSINNHALTTAPTNTARASRVAA